MISVAITGGTGFVGSALVEAHLRRGDRVRVLTRRPGAEPRGSIPVDGDLATGVPSAFADGADVVYHLAAELGDPTRMMEVNVRGTQRLLDEAAGRCGRWVQLSSVGVYGPPREGAPIDEGTEPRPSNDYERTKLEADRLVEGTCSARACPWGILRPSNIVGRGMRNRSAAALVRAIVRGRFAFVGRHDAVSTYIHVDDVVHALLLMAGAPSGTVVNVSSDCEWTALVARICHRARCRPPRLRVPVGIAWPAATVLGLLPRSPLTPSRVESLARRTGYSTGRAQALLGFVPSKPMPEGFDDVIDSVLSSQ